MRVLLLFLIIKITCENVHVEAKAASTLPKWGLQYTVNGKLIHTNGQITNTFQAWVDKKHGKSRVEYNGGAVIHFQFRNRGEFGRFYRVIPIVTDADENSIKCEKTDVKRKVDDDPNIEHMRIKTQSVLPDMKEFKFIGIKKILNEKCHKFLLKEEYTDDTSKEMYMYVQYQYTLRNHTKFVRYVPILYKELELDTDGKTVKWHKIFYDSYKPNLAEYNLNKVFRLDDEDCEVNTDFDGTIFNSINNFIHSNDEIEENPNYHKGYQDGYEQGLKEGLERGCQRTTESDYYDNYDDFSSTTTSNEYDTETAPNLPETVDWRLSGAVTPVSDQSALCGACWAFAAVGAVEGALFLQNTTEPLIRLSEQALIDCAWKHGNLGCNGGLAQDAYEWIKRNGGIPTYNSYGKYKAMEGVCHVKNPDIILKAPIIDWAQVPSGDAYEMKLALFKHGPVSVSIDATSTFSGYKAKHANEVFFDPDCGNEIDDLSHAVLVVGYGITEDGITEYWIVKNSFGVNWGHKGYALMSMRDNNCGILSNAVYPLLE